MRIQRSTLLSAVAGSVLLIASGAGAHAQSAEGGDTPFYKADGSTTANYDEAITSWREDPQFSVDYAKTSMGLEHAYARGLSGKGVTVAINDSGVYWDHPLFQGRNNGLDTGASDALGNNGTISSTEPWHAHGTHVAGSAVGRRLEGERMFGNAYNATIYSSTIHFAGSNFEYGPAYFGGEPMANGLANILAIAEGNHARIINNSWGISQTDIPYDASASDIREYFDEDGQVLANVDWQNLIDNDQLIVMSAGNDTVLSPDGDPAKNKAAHTSIYNLMPLYTPEMKDHFLTVVNYTEDGEASAGSSLCGMAATWCMSGPGSDIVSSVPDFSFDSERWLETYDFLSLDNFAEDLIYYALSEAFGIEGGLVKKFDIDIKNYLTRRDAAEADGVAFDSDAELNSLAISLSNFSKRFMTLADDPKTFIGIDVGFLTVALDEALKSGLTSEEAKLLSSSYRDDFIETVNGYMGPVVPGYASYTGTSMAAPNLTGVAAVLMENFPEYSTPLILDILLSNGVDLEGDGVDIRSGWGYPDVLAALGGPKALRDIREVRVDADTQDVWIHNISDAIDNYSPLVLERTPDDTGGLIKVGGGELVMTGTSTYSEETRVREGLLTLDGMLTRSALTVENVGIIGGTGTLASLTAGEGGVVAPGNSTDLFGTLNVSGDASFLPGSFLWVRANENASQYSKLNVEGATTLEGGNVIVKADTGTWNLRRRGMDILTSAGGVTGEFDDVTSDLGFLTPTLTYLPNGVQLQLVRNDVTIASAGVTENERNAGAALDVMTANNSTGNLDLEDAILDGSFAAVQNSLRYLTGEVHASLGGLTASDANHVREAMLDRGRTMPTGASAEQVVNNRGVTAWASGIWGNGEFDGNDDFSQYRNDTNGFAAGIDKVFENGAILGIAAGQSRSELKIDDLASTGKSTTTQVGLYAGTTVRGFGLRVGGTYIDSDFDTTRTVALNRFNDRLVGEYGGDGWQAWAEASFAAQAGNTAIEPYLNYTRYDFNADVSETGGDAALSGELDHTADLLTAGVRTSTLLAGNSGRPQIRLVGHLAYTENLDDDGLAFRARFADGPAFNISGPQPLDGGITTGVGVNIKATETLGFDVGYSGLHQSDFSDNRVYGRISLKF